MCFNAAGPEGLATRMRPGLKKGFPQKGSREGSWSGSPRAVLDLSAFRPVAFRRLAQEKGAYL